MTAVELEDQARSLGARLVDAAGRCIEDGINSRDARRILADLARMLRVIRRHPNPVKYFSRVKYITTVVTPLLLLGQADISSLATLTLRALFQPACVIHQPGTELLDSLLELKRECMNGLFLQGLAQHSISVMVAISDRQKELEDMEVEAERLAAEIQDVEKEADRALVAGPGGAPDGVAAIRAKEGPQLAMDREAEELSEIEPIAAMLAAEPLPEAEEESVPPALEGAPRGGGEGVRKEEPPFTPGHTAPDARGQVPATEPVAAASDPNDPLAALGALKSAEHSEGGQQDPSLLAQREHGEAGNVGDAVAAESPALPAPPTFDKEDTSARPRNVTYQRAVRRLRALKERRQEILVHRVRFDEEKVDHRDRILTFFALLEGIFSVRSPHHVREVSDMNSNILASMTSRKLMDVLAILLLDVVSPAHFLHDCSGHFLRMLAALANVKEMETCRTSHPAVSGSSAAGQSPAESPLVRHGKSKLRIEGDGVALDKAAGRKLGPSIASPTLGPRAVPRAGPASPSPQRAIISARQDALIASLASTSPLAKANEKSCSVSISRNTSLPGPLTRIARRDTAILAIQGSLRLSGVAPPSLAGTAVSRLLAPPSAPTAQADPPTYVSIPSYPPRQYTSVWQSFLRLPARKQAGDVFMLPTGMQMRDLLGSDSSSDEGAARAPAVRRKTVLVSDIPIDYIFVRDALWQAPATVQMFGTLAAKEFSAEASGTDRLEAPGMAALLSAASRTGRSALCSSAMFLFLRGCGEDMDRFLRIDSITTRDFCSRLSFMAGMDQSTDAYRAHSFSCCYFITAAYYFRLLRQGFAGRDSSERAHDGPRMWPRGGGPEGTAGGLALSDPRVVGFLDGLLAALSPALQRACRKDIAGLGIQDFEGEATRIRGTELLREMLGFLRAYHSHRLKHHSAMVAAATREVEMCANPMYAKVTGRTLAQAREGQLAEQRKLQTAEKELVDTVECLLTHAPLFSCVVTMLESWQAVRKKEAYGFNHLECLLAAASDLLWMLKTYSQLEAGKRQVFRLARGFLSRPGREEADSVSDEESSVEAGQSGAESFSSAVDGAESLLLEPLQAPGQDAGTAEPREPEVSEESSAPHDPGDIIVRKARRGGAPSGALQAAQAQDRFGAMPTDYGTVDTMTCRLVFGSKVLSNVLLLVDRAFDWSLSPAVGREAVARIEEMAENIRVAAEILDACVTADDQAGALGECLLSLPNAFVVRNAMTKSRAVLELCGYSFEDSEREGLMIRQVPPVPADLQTKALLPHCAVLQGLYRALHAIAEKFKQASLTSAESMVRTLIRPQALPTGAGEPMKYAKQRLYTLMMDMQLREAGDGDWKLPDAAPAPPSAPSRAREEPGDAPPNGNAPHPPAERGEGRRRGAERAQRNIQEEVARVVAQAAAEAANALDPQGTVSQEYEAFRDDFDNDLRALFRVRLPEPSDGEPDEIPGQGRGRPVRGPAVSDSSDDIGGSQDAVDASGHPPVEPPNAPPEERPPEPAQPPPLAGESSPSGSRSHSPMAPQHEGDAAYFSEQQDEYLLKELPSLARQYGGLEAALDVIVQKFDYFFTPEEVRERWAALNSSAGPFSADEDRQIEEFLSGKSRVSGDEWKVLASKLLRRPEAVRKRAAALGLAGRKQKK